MPDFLYLRKIKGERLKYAQNNVTELTVNFG